jgi:hypothetical protein
MLKRRYERPGTGGNGHFDRPWLPQLKQEPLTKRDKEMNAVFKSRVANIIPPERAGGGTKRQAAWPGSYVPDLGPKAQDIVSKIIGKPLTFANVQQWCSEHREDWEATVVTGSRYILRAGPESVDAVLKFLSKQGLERSEPLGLGPPEMAILELLIGGYPTGSGVRKWIAAHKNDWEGRLYSIRNRRVKKIAKVSAFLIAHGCEKAPGQNRPPA